jgi:hypothetical protein
MRKNTKNLELLKKAIKKINLVLRAKKFWFFREKFDRTYFGFCGNAKDKFVFLRLLMFDEGKNALY